MVKFPPSVGPRNSPNAKVELNIPDVRLAHCSSLFGYYSFKYLFIKGKIKTNGTPEKNPKINKNIDVYVNEPK